MVEIIGVRFNQAGKIYYFSPNGAEVSLGDMVVVETIRGVEIGRVSIPNRMISEDELESRLKSISRVATEEDLANFNQNTIDAKDAIEIAKRMVKEHKLEMSIIDCEYTLDKSKLLFYFTADGRVDFRDLVRSLATEFKTRIELRQIGVRDEARILGSIGMCGRPLCCSTFLENFKSVSVKMAKEQGISLNPIKISGTCGRLMCCLKYEYSNYEEALKNMPVKGATVETVDGTGKVMGREILKQTIRVKLDSDSDSYKYTTYHVGEFNIVGEEPMVALDELREKKAEEERIKAEAVLAKRREEEERIREFERATKKESQKGSGRRNSQKSRQKSRRPQNKKQSESEGRRTEKPRSKSEKRPDKKGVRPENKTNKKGDFRRQKPQENKKMNGGYSQ